MEALSSGASALAFATVALQGAGALYKIICAFRNGPRELQQLQSAIGELDTVLSRLIILAEDGVKSGVLDLDTLEEPLRACADDMIVFHLTLARCMASPQDAAWRKLFRTAWMALSQDELRQMRQVTLHHLAVLTLHVSVISRSVFLL